LQNVVIIFEISFATTYVERVQSFPVRPKPRFGKSSRDVWKIEDEIDLKYVASKFKNNDMMYQEFLPGTEYSVDILADLDKNHSRPELGYKLRQEYQRKVTS
jgi:carbamoyl-phosphate synthase large subunit